MYPVAREKLEPEENRIGECQETQVIADVESAVTKNAIYEVREVRIGLNSNNFPRTLGGAFTGEIILLPTAKRLSMLKIQEHGPIAEMIIINGTALAKAVMGKATRSGLNKNILNVFLRYRAGCLQVLGLRCKREVITFEGEGGSGPDPRGLLW